MKRKVIMLSGAILIIFVIAYYVKDKMGINILPHRHLLIFSEGK